MAHKTILLTATFALSITALAMKESPPMSPESYDKETSYEEITNALQECKQRIFNIQNALELAHKKFNTYDSNLDYNHQKTSECEMRIREMQKNIHFLQNSTKNNSLQADTLEQSVNLITEKMQNVAKDIEILKKNEENYVSKEDIIFLKKKKEEQSRSKITYEQYALKVLPLTIVMGILYVLRKPIRAYLYKALERVKLMLCRKKTSGRDNFPIVFLL